MRQGRGQQRSRSSASLGRLAKRLISRARGELDADWLVANGLILGTRTFIARNAYIDPGWPWLITIGDEATIGPRAIVLAHDASMQRHIGRTIISPVTIGRRVFVGAGSIILAGSTIGENAIIGAGAVVRGEIPAGALVVGNPGEVVSSVEKMAARHTDAAETAPRWPHAGWTFHRGITEERKRIQRETLASGIAGYMDHLPADPAPFEDPSASAG